jgi:hypothetical protein
VAPTAEEEEQEQAAAAVQLQHRVRRGCYSALCVALGSHTMEEGCRLLLIHYGN